MTVAIIRLITKIYRKKKMFTAALVVTNIERYKRNDIYIYNM